MKNLIWQDDFNGSSLDYTKWECEVNAFGGGNNELQIYTDNPRNVRVEDGCLVIEAHRDRTGISGTVREFSSGRVRTKHRGDWRYGRIEIRAKLPVGQGLWPAIWMLPTDEEYGGWAASGEIDIMEAVGQRPDVILGTLHYGGVWPANASNGPVYHALPDGKRYCDDFHNFAIEWDALGIRWFVDDVCFRQSPSSEWFSESLPSPAPFDRRFHLILNLAVGGNLCGNPDQTTKFPAKFLVDWVKVYQ
jgi:beta-glucanase (GH16 family)